MWFNYERRKRMYDVNKQKDNVWPKNKRTYLLNCFFSKWVPVPHPNIDIWRDALCFQSHFNCKCLLMDNEPASLVPAHYQYREFLLSVSGKGQKRFMLRKDKSSTKQIMGKPKNLNSTWSSVIFRKGEPPPIAAYPSLDLGARSTEINFANGRWRNRNNLGRRMISYVNTRNTLAYKSYEHVLMLMEFT